MTVEPTTLRDALGHWSAADQMLSAALADRLACLVDEGTLPDGALLPSRRQLATALSVSHNTVGAAYEMLTNRGMLEGRVLRCPAPRWRAQASA